MLDLFLNGFLGRRRQLNLIVLDRRSHVLDDLKNGTDRFLTHGVGVVLQRFSNRSWHTLFITLKFVEQAEQLDRQGSLDLGAGLLMDTLQGAGVGQPRRA